MVCAFSRHSSHFKWRKCRKESFRMNVDGKMVMRVEEDQRNDRWSLTQMIEEYGRNIHVAPTEKIE